jgi:hypothetical protein
MRKRIAEGVTPMLHSQRDERADVLEATVPV